MVRGAEVRDAGRLSRVREAGDGRADNHGGEAGRGREMGRQGGETDGAGPRWRGSGARGVSAGSCCAARRGPAWRVSAVGSARAAPRPPLCSLGPCIGLLSLSCVCVCVCVRVCACEREREKERERERERERAVNLHVLACPRSAPSAGSARVQRGLCAVSRLGRQSPARPVCKPVSQARKPKTAAGRRLSGVCTCGAT